METIMDVQEVVMYKLGICAQKVQIILIHVYINVESMDFNLLLENHVILGHHQDVNLTVQDLLMDIDVSM